MIGNKRIYVLAKIDHKQKYGFSQVTAVDQNYFEKWVSTEK
jgi:hypothetical protein